MYRDTGVVTMPQPTTGDDSSLLALVKSGDEQAMAALYDRYSTVVYSVSLRVLRDPAAAQSPESPGTWRWGGAYGHSWFVDPAQGLSVVALTNTALEGMSNWGRFPADLSRALYAAL